MNRRTGNEARRGHRGGWRARHREAWRSAWRRLRERPGAHAFALGLLALALLALVLLRAGVEQFRDLGAPLGEARTLSLFLDPALDQAAVNALADELENDSRILRMDRISPEQGLGELLGDDSRQQALAALPENPLPWVLALDPVDRVAGEALVAELSAHDAVQHITDDGDWHDRADAVLGAARLLVTVLSVLVGVAAVLLAANAVRTMRVEGREERALQRVFGATEADLRRPYLYLGALYGLIAGVLALLLAWMVLLALRPGFTALAEALQLTSEVSWVPPLWALAMPLLAALLGAIGAWFGCRFEPDLEVAG